MTDFEKLAILTGARKMLDADIRDVRASVEAELQRNPYSYEEPTALRLGGTEVGVIRHRFTRERTELRCDDIEAFIGWLSDDGLAYFEEFMLSKHAGKLLDACASALIVDGEVPAGCTVIDVPSSYIGIEVRGCEPDEVEHALRGSLPDAAVRLIGGGNG